MCSIRPLLIILLVVILPSMLVTAAGSMTLFNDTGTEVFGLRVSFDQPVTIANMGTDFGTWAVQEDQDTIVFQDGCVDAWGDFWFFWEPEDAALVSHEWLVERSRDPFITTPFPLWGFTLQGLSIAGFKDRELFSSLDHLIATGANNVTIAPQVFMGPPNSSYIEPVNTRYGHQLTDIARAIEYLVNAGITVSIKPNLLPEDGSWSAKIAPEDPELWFQNYKDVLLAYAQLAEDTGVAVLYLTNEMKSMIVNPLYTDYWLDVIASIRDVFSGGISLNATINDCGRDSEGIANSEVMNIPFADQLDFVGVSFYLPLTDKDDPTEGELESAWYGNRDGVNLIEVLKDIYRQYGKPVMISEIGYMSRDGVNRRPWDLKTVGVVDYQEQADLFEALMQVLTREGLSAEEDWLRGVSIWAWFTCADPATQLPGRYAGVLFGEQGEVVQNKPAEAVLTEWFHRLGGKEPPGTSGTVEVADPGNPVVFYDYSHSQGLAFSEDECQGDQC